MGGKEEEAGRGGGGGGGGGGEEEPLKRHALATPLSAFKDTLGRCSTAPALLSRRDPVLVLC